MDDDICDLEEDDLLDSDVEAGSDADEDDVSDTDMVQMQAVNTDNPENKIYQDDGNRHYKIMSASEIAEDMMECIKRVNQVTQIPHTSCRLLLTKYKWDKDRLMEAYFDQEQPDSLFTKANMISPHTKHWHLARKSNQYDDKAGSSSGAVGPVEDAMCDICCNSVPRKEMVGLGCSHVFCRECWRNYLKTKILTENRGETILCPGFNCSIHVEDDIVMQLITDQRVRQRFQKHITNSFVSCNSLITWCPGIDCEYAVRVDQREARRIVCKCGCEFCFICSRDWHDPVLCFYLKKWVKKCQDDSETSNWIVANTKECPKCNATIEKNGGCNHMVCKNPSCRTEFCWVCLGPWEPHGSSWYNCNRYDEDDAKRARDNQERSRAALQRYLHYCNRYMNHWDSLKFENKLHESIRSKMEEMQQFGMSWIEVQFLQKAVDVLCMCRRTLMYTYVFAYYLEKNNQSEIFEANQRDLEMATEQMSEYLERDITKDALNDIKQKVQDKYRYCENRRKKLLDHVHEGYDQDLWLYRE